MDGVFVSPALLFAAQVDQGPPKRPWMRKILLVESLYLNKSKEHSSLDGRVRGKKVGGELCLLHSDRYFGGRSMHLVHPTTQFQLHGVY